MRRLLRNIKENCNKEEKLEEGKLELNYKLIKINIFNFKSLKILLFKLL